MQTNWRCTHHQASWVALPADTLLALEGADAIGLEAGSSVEAHGLQVPGAAYRRWDLVCVLQRRCWQQAALDLEYTQRSTAIPTVSGTAESKYNPGGLGQEG